MHSTKNIIITNLACKNKKIASGWGDRGDTFSTGM